MQVVWILLLVAVTSAKFEIDGTVSGVNLNTKALQFVVTATESQNGPGNKTYELGLTSSDLTLTLRWSELKYNDTYFRYLKFSTGCDTVTELPDDSVEEEDVTFAMDNVTWKLIRQDEKIWLLYDETLFITLDLNSTCLDSFYTWNLYVDLSQFSGTYDTGKIYYMAGKTFLTVRNMTVCPVVVRFGFAWSHLKENR